MIEILFVGVGGAIVSAVVGTIWYNPDWTSMGKWHMQYLGFDKLSKKEQEAIRNEMAPQMWKSYSVQLILSLLTSLFIAFVTSYSVQNGAPASSIYYYIPMIWLCFTVPIIGQNILWGTSTGNLALAWKRFFSESFSSLITFMIIAYIATLVF